MLGHLPAGVAAALVSFLVILLASESHVPRALGPKRLDHQHDGDQHREGRQHEQCAESLMSTERVQHAR
jgi:hypothetical protein